MVLWNSIGYYGTLNQNPLCVMTIQWHVTLPYIDSNSSSWIARPYSIGRILQPSSTADSLLDCKILLSLIVNQDENSCESKMKHAMVTTYTQQVMYAIIP